ncbi:MAG: phage major capsid protein [Acidobacteriota bacterium]
MINTLKGQRQDLLKQAEQLIEKTKKENRGFIASEKSQHDGMMSEIKDLDRRIAEAELEIQQRRSKLFAGVPTLDPMGTYHGPRSEYRRMFGENTDKNEFNGLGDFMRSVVNRSRMYDPRLASRSGAVEGIPSAGGFLVPTEYAAGVFDAVFSNSVILSRCKKYAMNSATLNIPAFDSADRANGSVAGFVASWKAEGSTNTVQTPKVRNMELTANKMIILTKCSNEFFQDSPQGSQALTAAMSQAIQDYTDYYLINGSGAGQPLGLVNAPSVITQDKEVGQVADTFIFENAVRMFARLLPQSIMNSCWIMSPSVIPQLFAMTLNAGTAGQPVFMPDAKGTPGGTLFGLPIIFTDLCPALGDLGDVILADLSTYAVGMRSGIQIDVSSDVGFSDYETYFRAVIRMDGQSLLDKAVTPKKGTSTLSNIILLQAR